MNTGDTDTRNIVALEDFDWAVVMSALNHLSRTLPVIGGKTVLEIRDDIADQLGIEP